MDARCVQTLRRRAALSAAAVRGGPAGDGPDPEAVRRFLASLGAVRPLGSGAHGAVFEGRWHGAPAALKLVPHLPSRLLPWSCARYEHAANVAFAAAGLAWPPLGLLNDRAARGRGLSGRDEDCLDRNVAVLALRLLPETLDRTLQRGQLRRPELGRALCSLLRGALRAGLAHNDAKCNNIGALPYEGGFDLRFLDFGRALTARELRRRGFPEEAAARALRLASASDALRLAGSCRRALGGDAVADAVEAQLRAYAAELRDCEEADLGGELKALLGGRHGD